MSVGAGKDLTHCLYLELAEGDGDAAPKVKLLVWGNYLARQRFAEGQTRPHWKVYARTSADEARKLLQRQVDSFSTAGFRMVVDPILVAVTPDTPDEFAKSNVSYPLRGELNKAANRVRVDFPAGRPA